MSKVKIIRHANEGFVGRPYNSKLYCHGDTNSFLDITIHDYNQEIIATHKEGSLYEKNEMKGCHCFFYKYDASTIHPDRELSFRVGQKVNIAYLPNDELVFVRNIKPNGKKIVTQVQKEPSFHPETNECCISSRFVTDRFWVKMPLKLAVQRTNERFKLTGQLAERFTEIYLTEEQVERINNAGIKGVFKRLLV